MNHGMTALDRAKRNLQETLDLAREARGEEAFPAEAQPGSPQQDAVAAGLAKRESDARAAQRDLSQANNALTKSLEQAGQMAARLEDMASRLGQLNPAQFSPVDQESLKSAIAELVALDGGDVFAPVLRTFQSQFEEVWAAVNQLNSTMQQMLQAQRMALPTPKSNLEVLTELYGEAVINEINPEGKFVAYLDQFSGAVREGIVGLIDNYQTADRDDLVKEVGNFARWLGAAPAASAPAVPAVQPAQPAQPMLPDAVPAFARGGAGQPGAGAASPETVPILSPSEFKNFAAMMARLQKPEDKALLEKRYQATVREHLKAR